MSEQAQVEKLTKIYCEYQDKLLQITKKNRSIVLKRLNDKYNFDLIETEKIKAGTLKKIISNLVKSSTSSTNILPDRSYDQKSDFARTKLKTLDRNLQAIEEETGSQVGYIGFPFLVGHVNDDFYIRGPLVLFPINLERKRSSTNAGWFVDTSDKKPILNGALISALKKKSKVSLPEDYESTFDDLIYDIQQNDSDDLDYVFFTKINNWIKNFIQLDESKNKSDPDSFSDINQNEIDALGKQPFHLVNYKIMGSFPQADNEIFKDYTELIQKASLDSPILNQLLEIKDNFSNESKAEGPAEISDDSKNILLNLVVESDSSQDQVILESKKSDILVVSGPPGTGKSQVIVNLVSDALTNDQKVLVVCQKRAALEVVSDRLTEVGLDKYIVFLDKENDDRQKMYSNLNKIIEQECKPHPDSEIDVDLISSEIDKKTKSLADFGMALSNDDLVGASASKLYSLMESAYESKLELYRCEPETDFKNFEEYVQQVRMIEPLYKKYEDDDHPWFGRKPFFSFGGVDKSTINDAISDMLSLVSDSTLVPTLEEQKKLVTLFNTYLNNPGFLKIHRFGASKKISNILNTHVSEQFVSSNFDKIKKGLELWKKLFVVEKYFSEKRILEINSKITNTDQFKTFLERMRESLKEFDSISYYDKKSREIPKNILEILALCKNKFSLDDNWTEKIKQEIYAFWIDKIEKKHLDLISGLTEYEAKKNELAFLLNKKKSIVLNKITNTIDNVVNPKILYQKPKTGDQERWRDFNIALKRKKMPIRKLFETYPDLLLQIAPCWLSSPESVSKVFPLQKDLFDLIIVDEASQLAPERAIPFLYRAKRSVIAGDRQQLQPFDQFQVKEDESKKIQMELPEKSLLELAEVHSRNLLLRWHYRSKYQDLINFSNHAFYNGELNVVPNAKIDPLEPPIKWIKIKGEWNNSQNHEEAEEVILQLKNIWNDRFAKTGKFPTVGIITINEPQQDLIKELIDKKLDNEPEFAKLYSDAHDGKKKNDRLFIKNIENVQGDERDIIIFSITLAKDADGSFTNTRLSMINKKQGENRLNVAITRARDEMVIICSIDPGDIKETSENPGPKLLKKFLEYAIATSSLKKEVQHEIISNLDQGIPRRPGKVALDSEFEIQVQNRLLKEKYMVDTRVGESGYIIDLAINHPNKKNEYILAIECDGSTFHSVKNVKERDILRQSFLENKCWRIERIWSRNWWKNQDGEVDRIKSKINEIIQKESFTEVKTHQRSPPQRQALDVNGSQNNEEKRNQSYKTKSYKINQKKTSDSNKE